jgi:hypothetical protein
MKLPQRVRQAVGKTVRKMFGRVLDVCMGEKTDNLLIKQEADKMNEIISQESKALLREHGWNSRQKHENRLSSARRSRRKV